VTPETRGIPFRLVTYDQGVLACSDEPIPVDNKEPASHLPTADVLAPRDLNFVLIQTAAKGGLECLPGIDDLASAVKRIDALLSRCDVRVKWVFRTSLKLLDELVGIRLVELEYEMVLFAHGGASRGIVVLH